MKVTLPQRSKANFLWLPLSLIVLGNFLYLILAFFGMFMVISEGKADFSKPGLFIASSVIIMGFGLPVILISDAIGAIIGFAVALFIRKPLPKWLKRFIGWFLVFFYTLIGSSLIFLMTKY